MWFKMNEYKFADKDSLGYTLAKFIVSKKFNLFRIERGLQMALQQAIEHLKNYDEQFGILKINSLAGGKFLSNYMNSDQYNLIHAERGIESANKSLAQYMQESSQEQIKSAPISTSAMASQFYFKSERYRLIASNKNKNQPQ